MENRALVLICWCCFVFHSGLLAQSDPVKSVGVELQAYPTGIILGVRADFSVSEHIALNGRLGYNLARRRDLGEHDDERGGGFGGSFGSRYFFKQDFQGFFIGVRVDLWAMEIDWTTTVSDPETTGVTNITVLQPLIAGGYAFVLPSGNWVITPKISLGYEINLKTKGEAVGEGAISLIGVSVCRRF